MVEGFVLGSVSHADLRRDVVRRNPLGVVVGIAVGVPRRPIALWRLLRSAGGPEAGHYDTTAPELIYLAVSPDRHGRGVGRRLVGAFSAAMRAAGHTRFELSVDEDNREATAFYDRLGFTRVGEYHEFGRHHVRYATTLPPAP